tara:strand:- start:3568 stop:4446 length:879 start_codon:yes stop_codon:yes gene_type:complete
MLPDLPFIDPKVNGARSGGLLNRLVDRIKMQRLRSSETVIITETKDGQIIDRLGSGGVAAPFALGFAVSLDGTNVVVAPGKFIYPLWGAILGDNPTPGDWQREVNYIGGTLTGTVTQVWLSVLWSENDTTTTGPLGTTTYDISGAAGGRGGGGGGGGAAGGVSPDQEPQAGEAGTSGDVGGLGGAGGIVLDMDAIPPVPITGLGNSYGASGGTGGYGGAGGDGGSVTFTRSTKGTAQIRKWSINGLSLHTAKGSASEALSWIQLATISGTSITQHVAGTISITPPAITFIIA